MITVELTQDQKNAIDLVVERIKKGESLTTLGGYAGVGKTTVVGAIVSILRESNQELKVAFACYTGKAKNVLESKLKKWDAIKTGDFCGTLHSLLYRPITSYKNDEKEKTIEKIVTFDSKDQEEKYGLLVIDEASMVTEEIFKEISEFEIPILAIGDHAQLPPVFGSFNLMSNPMIRLEKIHRQAEHNPIIQLSMMARETGAIPVGEYGPTCVKTTDGTYINRLMDPGRHEWMLICGTNAKRCRLNGWVRHKKLGANFPEPIPGEKVICLQNNHKRGIFNGMTGIIISLNVVDEHWYWAEINMGDFVYKGRIFRWQFGKDKTLKKTVHEAPQVHPDDFGDLFDYGYCLTAHKAQGSEADRVVVFEEDRMRLMMERQHNGEGWRRWLYTAVTRAREQLIIVGE